MSLERFKVTVEFTVLAEPLGPWTSEQCAADFIAHRIDEGYRLEDRIMDWKFVAVVSEGAATAEDLGEDDL